MATGIKYFIGCGSLNLSTIVLAFEQSYSGGVGC